MGRGERGCAEARAAADGAGREGHSVVTAAARARKQGAAAAAAGCGKLPFFFAAVACEAMTVNMLFKMVPNVSFVYFAEHPFSDDSSQ